MSLLKPSLGELLDRLSILELKIEHGGGAHHERELAEIRNCVFLRCLDEKPAKRVAKLAKQLKAVNEKLWYLTDEQRNFCMPSSWAAYEEAAARCEKGAELLIDIREANSDRITIREKIDMLSGDFLGHEKV